MVRRMAACLGLALFALLALQVPAWAQTAAATTANDGPAHYDISKEITLNGTVSDVLKAPSPGMIMGSHLIFATASGTVDASLGRTAFRGVNPLSVTVGEHVEVTGVMKTISGRHVFLVRTVKVNDHVYTLRNERGVGIVTHDGLPSPELIRAKGAQ